MSLSFIEGIIHSQQPEGGSKAYQRLFKDLPGKATLVEDLSRIIGASTSIENPLNALAEQNLKRVEEAANGVLGRVISNQPV